jgi:type II secretory pathway pseudopilin PulG
LIELMVVVSIIGISLLAFAPKFVETMADRRCATATMEMVRIGRRARSEAIGLQRAFLVNISYGIAPLHVARYLLLRGNSTRCDGELSWAQQAAGCRLTGDGAERGAGSCMEMMNLDSTHWYKPPFAITIGMWGVNETPTNLAPDALIREVGSGARNGDISICYEPNGLVRWSTHALDTGAQMQFSSLNAGVAAGGGLMFASGLININTRELVNTPRVALFPLAAPPRRLR